MKKPAKYGLPGTRTRFDELVATHVMQAEWTHGVVSLLLQIVPIGLGRLGRDGKGIEERERFERITRCRNLRLTGVCGLGPVPPLPSLPDAYARVLA